MFCTKISPASISMEGAGTVWYEGWYYTSVEGSKVERRSTEVLGEV